MRFRKVAGWTVVLLGAMSFLFSWRGARARENSAGGTNGGPRSSKVERPSSARHRVAWKSKTRLRNSSRGSRATSYHRRIAQLHPSTGRIEEIQRALAQAGYLNQEPSGKWDDTTRAAMLRYQSESGLPATGMPEAKSLMKLGLGPHPLPGDVDPRVASLAGGVSSTPTAAPDPAAPPLAEQKEQ